MKGQFVGCLRTLSELLRLYSVYMRWKDEHEWWVGGGLNGGGRGTFEDKPVQQLATEIEESHFQNSGVTRPKHLQNTSWNKMYGCAEFS